MTAAAEGKRNGVLLMFVDLVATLLLTVMLGRVLLYRNWVVVVLTNIASLLISLLLGDEVKFSKGS